jgi:NSS family neurotransmitter:Na+ symporter
MLFVWAVKNAIIGNISMESAVQTSSPQWSSRFAFTLAAIGSSVGLGNLWRFSAEAGTNGGGAFILIYVLCVLVIGIPTIMGEFIIGRAGRATSAINSFKDVATRSHSTKRWSLGASVGTISGFLILSFYCVVAAWVMAYVQRFMVGAFDGLTPVQIAEQFDSLIINPKALLAYFLLFSGLVIWLVARGVNRGLEWASKIFMPIFFFLLLGLSAFSVYSAWPSGGTEQALNFMFSTDMSKISPKVAISALGQAFFSLGLGMAIMITYGSYLPKSVSLAQSALIVGLADTGVALIAGLAIFPIVFQYGLDFEAGAGLFFQTLPTALLSTPGGNIIGAAFFCMAFFAALTTAVSLLEPSVAHITEQFRLKRSHASLIMGAIMIIIGLVCLYDLSFLDFLDKGLTAPILLPLSALTVVLFVGWRLNKKVLNDELAESDRKLAYVLFFMLKYVAPVMIFVIFVAGISGRYFPSLMAG